MIKQQRIPLRERLRKVRSEKPNFLNVFEIFMDDYFTALSRIGRNLFFADYYETNIVPLQEGRNYPYLMAQFIVALDDQPKEERQDILYHTLIVPFVDIDPSSLRFEL